MRNGEVSLTDIFLMAHFLESIKWRKLSLLCMRHTANSVSDIRKVSSKTTF